MWTNVSAATELFALVGTAMQEKDGDACIELHFSARTLRRMLSRLAMWLVVWLLVSVLVLRRYAGWQTKGELQLWFGLGVARHFLFGTGVAILKRAGRLGEPQHESWGFGTEIFNAGARQTAFFLSEMMIFHEDNFELMRGGFEVVAMSTIDEMDASGFTTFDYYAGTVLCRAVLPKRLLPELKRELGLTVSEEDLQTAETGWNVTLAKGPWNPVSSRIKWLIHFHGGGYISGTPLASQPIGWHYGEHAENHRNPFDLIVVIPHYALAPERKFPAAVLDAVECFEFHMDLPGVSSEDIVIAGESAGGGLTAAMLIALRDGVDAHVDELEGRRLRTLKGRVSPEHIPAAAVIMSPFVDLDHEADFCDERAEFDIITEESAQNSAKMYVPDPNVATSNPLASPIRGELHGMPPLLITAGEREIFMPKVVEFAERAILHDEHNLVELIVFEGQIHSFQLGWVKGSDSRVSLESSRLFNRTMDFILDHTRQ